MLTLASTIVPSFSNAIQHTHPSASKAVWQPLNIIELWPKAWNKMKCYGCVVYGSSAFLCENVNFIMAMHALTKLLSR